MYFPPPPRIHFIFTESQGIQLKHTYLSTFVHNISLYLELWGCLDTKCIKSKSQFETCAEDKIEIEIRPEIFHNCCVHLQPVSMDYGDPLKNEIATTITLSISLFCTLQFVTSLT